MQWNHAAIVVPRMGHAIVEFGGQVRVLGEVPVEETAIDAQPSTVKTPIGLVSKTKNKRGTGRGTGRVTRRVTGRVTRRRTGRGRKLDRRRRYDKHS